MYPEPARERGLPGRRAGAGRPGEEPAGAAGRVHPPRSGGTAPGAAERRGHAISRVLAEVGLIGLGLNEVEARKQISRMNAASRTATMRAGLTPMELVEKAKGGYRLANGMDV